ncbi:MAG: hypothetical protein V7607_1206 [Solirubrobacteraceae bacterium]
MWRVTILGGAMTCSLTFRFTETPEDREVQALVSKHGASTAVVRVPDPTEDTR